MEFEKQSEIMDMKEEMMNDAIDDAMGDDEDEEERQEPSLLLCSFLIVMVLVSLNAPLTIFEFYCFSIFEVVICVISLQNYFCVKFIKLNYLNLIPTPSF